MKTESSLAFALDRAFLDGGGVQYQSRLIPASSAVQAEEDFQRILPLDLPGYWNARGGDAYSVMLGRVTFTVDRPVSYYSAARSLDVERMNRLMPEFPARSDGAPGRYRSVATPGCRFTVEHFTRDQLLALGSARPELRFAEREHPELGVPDAIVLQHNFEFDRVFGFRTSRGALTLTAHYALSAGRTLILTWSLGYLHNLPPEMWGGSRLVVEKSREATLNLIERLRQE